MRYGSAYGKDELIKRWDEITSPARFAGANDELDWVYNASRDGDKIRLVKKPRAAYDPYATVFRGTVRDTEKGSAIVGVFTKGLADYLITLFISFIYFGVCAAYASRAADRTIPLMLISVGIAAVIFVLTPLPGKRKKYSALIREVTGPDPDAKVPAEEETDAAPAQDKEKYKFRLKGKR